MCREQREHRTANGGETMKKITKIEPSAARPTAAKIRVAAYCRVSTGMDEQLVSLETQKNHYKELIGSNPEWVYAGLYYDEGISGTSKEKRPALQRMIADCEQGLVDRVLTKSLSRFSQNVRLGLQYRYQQGKVQVCANRFLGYDKDEDGNLVINPEEAEVVKRIYREYLGGKSYYAIGQGLTADGIRTAAGNDYWLASTLRKILTNEKYIGDALLQKTVTTDFLNKKRVANKGIVPQYYVENSHEAIIPRALFLQVQEEMVRRARVKTGTGKRRVYSGKYALSHLVYCSDCGDLYRRTQWFLKGEHVPVWRCVSRLEKKKSGIDCPSRTIYEADLHAAVVTAFNQMIEQKDEFLPGMRLAVELALGQSNSPRVAEIDTRLEALQKELLKKANAKQGFEELADEIDALREEKQDLLVEDANRAAMKQRLDELEEFLDEHQEPVTDYDEGMVRRLIERITVYEDHLDFEFKSGLETEVQM